MAASTQVPKGLRPMVSYETTMGSELKVFLCVLVKGVLKSELWAIFHGLEMGLQRKITRLVVESDSQ